MQAIKKFRLPICLFLVLMLCLVFGNGQAQAGGTDESDKANNIFVYADDVNGDSVLLKVIPLETLKTLAHGQNGTDSTYYGSFIDKYPTPTYCEGKGVTIPDLLTYVKEHTSVANADSLAYQGSDKLYFASCDGPTTYVNYKYSELLGVDRYYFPLLYSYWDAGETEVSDVAAVLSNKTPMPVYLATESLGGRVSATAGGNNISGYVTTNGGVVTGSLTNALDDTESLRLVMPQTESDITDSTATYSDIRKWVYKIRLREVTSASPIEALGTVSDPTCTYTLDGTTLTITMDCADEDASIYYSTIGGCNANSGEPLYRSDRGGKL